MARIYSLMAVTRENHAQNSPVTHIISVGSKQWQEHFNVTWKKIDKEFLLPTLNVDIESAKSGADVRIRWSFDDVIVDITDCATGIKKRNKFD